MKLTPYRCGPAGCDFPSDAEAIAWRGSGSILGVAVIVRDADGVELARKEMALEEYEKYEALSKD